jgi:repressor LexA
MNTSRKNEYSRRPESERQCVSVPIEDLELPSPQRCFGLRVRGDAMTGRHILEGDIVFIDPNRMPSSGRVVAALVDGEPVLRTFVNDGGRNYLRAENPNYPRQVPVRELVIQGVLVGMVRFTDQTSGTLPRYPSPASV